MLKLICLFLFTAFSNIVVAQNNVGLFEKCNYGGKKSFLSPGSYKLSQMGMDNDQLSSIQIPNGMRVTIYVDDEFKGQSATYTSSVSCLTDGWNDNASSVVVEYTRNIETYNQKDYVTFYNDCYQKGYSQSLRPGTYSGSQLGQSFQNLSSFSISGNLKVKLYTNENTYGYNLSFESSQACLGSDLNDKVSSLVIEYKGNNGYQNNNGYNNNNNYGNNNNGNNGNSYATVYMDCNYSGSSLRLGPGNYAGDKLGLMKYDISSIKIPSNLQAKVFVNNEYLNGYSYTLTDNNSCLPNNMNNRIGSLVIEERYGNNNYGNNGNNGNYNNGYNNDQRVVIYQDENYKGLSASLLPGTYATMEQAGFIDDALSSLTVPPGYRVVIYEYPNFKGKSYTITQSKSGFILSNWNDKTSSIAVYKN